MKNQYFADINDYRKYGLLRILAGSGRLKIAVCWMLTEGDLRTDGNSVAYLNDPRKWSKYDPDLFDSLHSCMLDVGNRKVTWAGENRLIPGAVYFPNVLVQQRQERQQFFQAFHDVAAGCDLAFFDPDNGLEVKSVPLGRRNSPKYIYWPELAEAFAAGRSLLVYQHFIRINRAMFTAQLVSRFHERLGISEMMSLATANVLFLLVPQDQHRSYLSAKCQEIGARWHSQISVSYHRCE